MKDRFALICLVLFAAPSLTGCSSEMASLAELPAVPAQEYRLDSGDEVRVFVYGIDAINNNYVINGQGQLSLPLVKGISAAGKTVHELESSIGQALLEKRILVSPNVNVQPVKLRPFFILGEVRSPGQYAYSPGMSVLSAVSSAGGFTFRADQRSIVVRRTQNGSTVKGRADDTTPILPGDTIKVLEKWF